MLAVFVALEPQPAVSHADKAATQHLMTRPDFMGSKVPQDAGGGTPAAERDFSHRNARLDW